MSANVEYVTRAEFEAYKSEKEAEFAAYVEKNEAEKAELKDRVSKLEQFCKDFSYLTKEFVKGRTRELAGLGHDYIVDLVNKGYSYLIS